MEGSTTKTLPLPRHGEQGSRSRTTPCPLQQAQSSAMKPLLRMGSIGTNLLWGNGQDEVDGVAAIRATKCEPVLCLVKLRDLQPLMKPGFGNSVFLIMSPQNLGTFFATRLIDGVFHRKLNRWPTRILPTPYSRHRKHGRASEVPRQLAASLSPGWAIEIRQSSWRYGSLP